MEDEASIELRQAPERPVPAADRRELKGNKEAFLHAWRPAGSSSLGERWLRAGEDEQPRSGKHRDLWKAARALLK